MKNNIKILQLVDSLEIGGSERMSVNMYNTFTSNDINNCLVVSRKSGSLYSFVNNKSNVHFLNKRSFFDYLAFFKFFKLLKNYKPTIVHAHQTSIYWAFLVKLLFPKTILIWHDHWGFSDLFKKSDRKIVKMFSFLINGVVCVNEKIRTWNINNLKVNKAFIVFIPNYPLFKIIDHKKTNKNVLICLANIRDQKDHENLVRACFILQNQHIDFKLLLAGSLDDENYVEKIKSLIKELNLVKKIQILGPVINVSEILAKANIGVLSSVSEGLPLSLLEYGIAGLPVVCTDVGQCRDVLGNGEFGWVVPSKSPKKLALAIKEALDNPKLADSKAIGLKKHVQKNYGSEGFVLKYFELINKVKNIV